MTSKSRITNPLALAVLAHLYEKPRHPYELASTLRERRKEASIKLNYGSLYTVIEALERERYIRALETSREGRRPEKTTYEITDSGISFMMYWMRELVSTPVKEFPKFEAALSLIPILPPEEVISLLEDRLRHLEERMKSIKGEEQERIQAQLPRLFALESEYFENLTKAEIRFVEKLHHDLKEDVGHIASEWRHLRKSALTKRKPNKKEKSK